MEDPPFSADVHQLTNKSTSQCTVGFLARSPPVAVIVFIICGIIILPATIFVALTIVALFFTYIGMLEIAGDMMLYKIMFFGFLISVGIIFLVTSGTIFAWYYGLSRMYKLYFNLKKETPQVNKQHTQ